MTLHRSSVETGQSIRRKPSAYRLKFNLHVFRNLFVSCRGGCGLCDAVSPSAGHSVLNVAAFPYNSPIPFQTTLPDHTAASAQAANGAAPLTTDQPVVDAILFGDGVIDCMCATPRDSDDDA